MIHKDLLCYFFGIAVAAMSQIAIAQPKIPPKYPATPQEILSLPKYCYQQYVDGSLSGTNFSIPSNLCGYEMNHFCPGLVDLIHASQVNRSRAERQGALNGAIENINYTIRGMKPGCFIARDVQTAKMKAQMLHNIIK